MKNLFKLTFVAAIILLFTAATPAHKPSHKTSVSVYVGNGTAWTGTLDIVGGLYGGFGTSGYYYMGQVSTGTYTVTLSINEPGSVSHTYMFTNAPTQVSSSGSVTWYNVNITGTSTGSIY